MVSCLVVWLTKEQKHQRQLITIPACLSGSPAMETYGENGQWVGGQMDAERDELMDRWKDVGIGG